MLLKANKPDPAHNRELPTGEELVYQEVGGEQQPGPILQVQNRIWDEVRAWLPFARFREPPKPLRWDEILAKACYPAIVQYYVRGAREAEMVLRQLMEGRKPRLLYRTGGHKGAFLELAFEKDVLADSLAFDVFNPMVRTAIERATLDFARSTLNTMRNDLQETWREFLRQTLTQGMEAGDALKQLARDVGKIIRNPDKALTVAATEASRAVHAGQAMLDEQSGVVAGRKWLASSDACDRCLALNGKVIPMDGNFVTGAGDYGNVPYPPLHPRCQCSAVAILKEEYRP